MVLYQGELGQLQALILRKLDDCREELDIEQSYKILEREPLHLGELRTWKRSSDQFELAASSTSRLQSRICLLAASQSI